MNRFINIWMKRCVNINNNILASKLVPKLIYLFQKCSQTNDSLWSTLSYLYTRASLAFVNNYNKQVFNLFIFLPHQVFVLLLVYFFYHFDKRLNSKLTYHTQLATIWVGSRLRNEYNVKISKWSYTIKRWSRWQSHRNESWCSVFKKIEETLVKAKKIF